MKPNIGTLDKTVRIALAAIIAVLYFSQLISGTLALVLLVLAGILIVTSFISFCPLYWPFGISTRKQRS